MTNHDDGALRTRLEAYVGKPMTAGAPSVAPDPVNLAMIRHWVDAFDDQNPVYLDTAAAVTTRFGEVVAPPAMLQTWTMARPIVQGLAERGGSAQPMGDNVLTALDAAGYTATRATNSDLEFDRYLHLGDQLSATTVLESISEEKVTALGTGFFVTWVSTYTDQYGDAVGRQRFRVLKFKANASADL